MPLLLVPQLQEQRWFGLSTSAMVGALDALSTPTGTIGRSASPWAKRLKILLCSQMEQKSTVAAGTESGLSLTAAIGVGRSLYSSTDRQGEPGGSVVRLGFSSACGRLKFTKAELYTGKNGTRVSASCASDRSIEDAG